MGALVLSSLLSPKGILIGIITLIVGFLIYSGIHFEENYVALVKTNTTLQLNLTTTQDALKQEQKSAATQAQIDSTTLNSVRQVTAQQAQQISQLQSDTAALQTLGTPTNEDFQCVHSPYVSTILNLLRQRSSPSTANSGSTSSSDAVTTSRIDSTFTTTANTTQ